MMKRSISILAVSLLSVVAMGQVKIADFESGMGSWTQVGCSAGVEDNPVQSGLNQSCKALAVVRTPECDKWSGAMVTLGSPVSGYRYVHMLMYRNNSHQPNLKVYNPATEDGSADLTPMNTIVANEWQDVVFDINGHDAEFIFVMVDRENLSSEAKMYVDDIVLSNDASPRTTPNTACGSTDQPTQPEEPDQPASTDGYKLVWNADFVNESLDESAWNIEVNGDGGGNNELQYYCEKGVSMGVEPTTGKHCLILTATKEDYMGKGCTSGRVNTKHKVNFTYGKVEARIGFPNTANGLWPAFWMLGENIDEVGWPKCGETDIIELGHQDGFNGVQDRYFNGAMHVGEAWNSVWQDVNSVTYDYSVEDGFHIFTCEWTPTSVKMYVDKDTHPGVQPYFQAQLEENDNPYYNRQLVWSKPSFVIFNLAVGGNFPGIYNVDQITALANGSRKMYVDWLRIYQKGEAGESFYSNVASDPIEGGVQDGLIPAISSDAASKKVLRNGQIVIERNGETFTILGNRLQ